MKKLVTASIIALAMTLAISLTASADGPRERGRQAGPSAHRERQVNHDQNRKKPQPGVSHRQPGQRESRRQLGENRRPGDNRRVGDNNKRRGDDRRFGDNHKRRGDNRRFGDNNRRHDDNRRFGDNHKRRGDDRRFEDRNRRHGDNRRFGDNRRPGRGFEGRAPQPRREIHRRPVMGPPPEVRVYQPEVVVYQEDSAPSYGPSFNIDFATPDGGSIAFGTGGGEFSFGFSLPTGGGY